MEHGQSETWWGFVIEGKEERVNYNLALEAFALK